MDDKEKLAAQIDYYVRLVLKKRWFIIIPFCLSMLVGIYLALTLPKIYSASNLILVVPKSVPDRYVPTVLETDVQDRINTIKQQIMSRSNLERLIEELELFSGPEHQNMYLVDKVENIRRNTTVNVTKSRSGIDSFTIEYRAQDPQKVMQVVNRLADSFINESVKIMENEIIDTNLFLEDELANLNKRLKEVEASIQEYRKAHMGELPEELSSHLSTINRLQEQLNGKQENLRDARNRIAALEDRIAFVKSNADSLASLPNSTPDAGPAKEPKLSDLEKLRLTLKGLKTKYTDQHPDIVRIKAAIAQLETGGAESGIDSSRPRGIQMMRAEDGRPDREQALLSANMEQVQFDLTAQYNDLKREIAIYNSDIRKIESEIEHYQKRVENIPKVKHELLALERVHANVQGQYNRFLERKLESDIAVNMERKQKGQKFRVLDSARLPQKPVSPDIKRLLIMCLAAGLGIGCGIIFLLDYADNTLRLPANIEPTFGVPVLAILPKKIERRDRIMHRINQGFSAVSITVGGILLSIMVVFALKGVERTVEMVKKLI